MKHENGTFLLAAFVCLGTALVTSLLGIEQYFFWQFVMFSFLAFFVWCYFEHIDTHFDLWKENLDKCCKNSYISNYYKRY